MTLSKAIEVTQLTHRYGSRVAVDHLNLTVNRGEVFAVLGPNGGGKTTLFRILSTLIPPQTGNVRLGGFDVVTDCFEVRRRIGVAFQSCSLDAKLTVDENLALQGSLYGMRGSAFEKRRSEVLERLGVVDRRSDFVETLSGGLQRRVDLAKALLHRPSILLMDEPTTGLDPGARSDLWQYLRQLREDGATIVMTTHLLEEADRADRIAILHNGALVAAGAPNVLRSELGGSSITVETDSPHDLVNEINQQWKCDATVVGDSIRISDGDANNLPAQLMTAFPAAINSVKLGRPTLEDVFIEKTGHQFWVHTEPQPVKHNRVKR